MDRWIGPGLGLVALLVGVWNTWTLSSLRTEQVTVTAPRASSDTRVARVQGGPPQRMMPPAPPRGPRALTPAKVPRPRLDPAKVAELRAQRDSERTERMVEHAQTEGAAFAKEEGLDAATSEKLLAALEQRFESFRLLREDVRAGKVGADDAQDEYDAMRDLSDTTLAGILGEERFGRLTARLATLSPSKKP